MTFGDPYLLSNAAAIYDDCASSAYSTGMADIGGVLYISGLDSISERRGVPRVDAFANLPRIRRFIDPDVCRRWDESGEGGSP